jgi:hypothetical protein
VKLRAVNKGARSRDFRRHAIHPRGADEIADECVLRPLEQVVGGADLHGLALVHHHDVVGKGQRLDLIVRQIDHQEIEGPMNSLQLPLDRGVDHRQRLVERDCRHIRANQAAAQRDLLLGVGGEPAGAAVQDAVRSSIAAISVTRLSIAALESLLFFKGNARFSATVIVS